MRFQYQLVILGNIENSYCKTIRERFFEKVRNIGLTEDMFEVLFCDNFKDRYLNQQPTFCFYFGEPNHNDLDNDILRILIDNGDAIFPIYFGEDFNSETPEILHKMNGRQFQIEAIDVFVNRALECFKLLRESRRLFISYRRQDSSAVAHQLFEAFVKQNYDVFLDSYSINPAENFQEALHHRLTDCDVLLQLYTENFKGSPWCNEEIASANQQQIGVVEIIWPDCKPDVHNELCEFYTLNKDSFIDVSGDSSGFKLTNTEISNIRVLVESVRARNMAARQDNLVGEFVDEASKNGHSLIKEFEYLIEETPEGKKRLFVPAVGVPQSYDCYSSLRFREILGEQNLQTYLIYDDLNVRKRWLQHLDWLNKSIEVKMIKKQDFSLWLKNN